MAAMKRRETSKKKNKSIGVSLVSTSETDPAEIQALVCCMMFNKVSVVSVNGTMWDLRELLQN